MMSRICIHLHEHHGIIYQVRTMPSKWPGLPSGKSQRKIVCPLGLGDEEDRETWVPPRSQESEDLDVTKMAQRMINAVHLIASRLFTLTN